jgi:hypothetical protein
VHLHDEPQPLPPTRRLRARRFGRFREVALALVLRKGGAWLGRAGFGARCRGFSRHTSTRLAHMGHLLGITSSSYPLSARSHGAPPRPLRGPQWADGSGAAASFIAAQGQTWANDRLKALAAGSATRRTVDEAARLGVHDDAAIVAMDRRSLASLTRRVRCWKALEEVGSVYTQA